MAQSRLTATSTSWVQAILLPQPPEMTLYLEWFESKGEFSGILTSSGLTNSSNMKIKKVIFLWFKFVNCTLSVGDVVE